MRSRLILIAAVLFAALPAFAAEGPASRTFDATYTATIRNIPADAGVLNVWIPLPTTRPEQAITDVIIDSPYDWKRLKESEFGDEYAFAKIPAPLTGELTVRVRFHGTRLAVATERIANVRLSASERRRALKADRLVTLSPRIRKLADELTLGKSTTMEQAQAIYEYVVTHMKYDKTIPGWGNGDTERACDIRAGNCTDFHSLFISLVRARSIPARFTIGFPLPKETDGTITGYHCWAEFYVQGKGWIPVDASEASKSSDPAVRAFLFGNLGVDRVGFTMGRDLTLSPATAEPVNFFIYPRAEAKNKAVGAPTVTLEVHDVKGGSAVTSAAER